MKGTIKVFFERKNYGFITPDDGSEDVFFHVSEVQGDVSEGDAVEFNKEQGDKGPKAVGVKAASAATEATETEEATTSETEETEESEESEDTEEETEKEE